jgi:hypothetical protein
MSLRKFFRRLFESRPAPSDIKIVIAKAPREWNMKECALAMGYGASKYKAAAWSAKWGHAPLSFPNRPLYPYKLAEFDQAVSRLHRAGICKPFVHEISTNADIDRVIASRLKQKETAMKVVEFIVPFKRFGRGLTQEWSEKEKAILKALTAIGVNETAVLQRVSMDRYGSMKVRCRPEQFAQFMIDRNKFGGENWFTELSPTMTAHPAEAKFGQPVLFDVTDYANKFCNVMNFNINSDPVKDGQTTEVCAAIRADSGFVSPGDWRDSMADAPCGPAFAPIKADHALTLREALDLLGVLEDGGSGLSYYESDGRLDYGDGSETRYAFHLPDNVTPASADRVARLLKSRRLL